MEKEAEDEEERDDENEYAQCSVKALDRSEWRNTVSNLYAETKLRLIEKIEK